MQAIILAGGFGTRLSQVVRHVPKPMAEITHEPFLAVLLRYAQTQGVSDVLLCLHHGAETIRDYFGDAFEGLRIRYAIEPLPLGTGGAIRRALGTMDNGKPVLVMNGDSLVMLDYREMMARHRAAGAPLTIASVEMPVTDRYSRLTCDGDRIVRYDALGDAEPGAISVGFYIVQPDLFDDCPLPEVFSFERDFLAVHTPRLLPLRFERVEYFIDIGVPEDYARARAEVPPRMEKVA